MMIKGKHIKYPLLILMVFISLVSMSGQLSTINYTDADEDFVNPERGFYRYSQTFSSNYTFLDENQLRNRRSSHEPHNDGYTIYSSLVFRYFVLDAFLNDSLSTDYLDNLQADFDIVRAAGVKIIPRFAYIIEANQGDCGSFICPPYGDASKTQMLKHIEQLKDVLHANSDVIAVVQMGFIGTWGEQYYTDFFGDASQSPFILTDTNWQDRNDILEELLKSVPENRMVQVRYPQLKQRYIYGINAPTTSAALTESEAYQTTDKARTGFHNDCILASSTDFGTYNDYGNSSSSSAADTTNLKPYKADDTKFTAMGGETCSAYNPYDNCAGTDPDARADSELKRMHYSYLNAEFNYPDVNSDWNGQCMEAIKKEIGYRFVFLNSSIEETMDKGGNVTLSLSLKNVGYAAPFNERVAQLVLRNVISGKEYFSTINSDPRYWFRENATIEINQSFCLPYYMEAGNYEVLLFLGDASASIHERPEYAIRIASKLPDGTDVWEESTGYNTLGHTIEVTLPEQMESCNGVVNGFKPCKNLITNHTVCIISDSGEGSLRQLVDDANCGDTIFIPSSFDNQSIQINSAIDIFKDVVIVGQGPSLSSINAGGMDRIFNIQEGTHVFLHEILLTNGAAITDGGAFLNEGFLFLKNIHLEANTENGSPKSFTNKNELVIQNGNTILRE